MRFHVEAMTCGGCARSVTKAIERLDPSAAVTIDGPARIVEVTSARPAVDVAAALATAGFPAVELQSAGAAER